MDFDRAVQRLAKGNSGRGTRRSHLEISAKAKREAELRKKQQERLAEERRLAQARQEAIQKYMTQCQRQLGVRDVVSEPLKATSIHGDGDKIALPPSVLERLTMDGMETTAGNPWTFRIGILNPDYSFPASPLISSIKFSEDAMEDSDSSDDEDETPTAAYLDELSHKYLSLVHGSVVEFTQEEGHVGLPESIASALLQNSSVPSHRTVDPAAGDEVMQEDDLDDEQTPGHLAWGAFDIPSLPIEVSLVKLPKGKACTIVPTEAAIENGFYNLPDVKLVLEQSLIRTRATLSKGDVVRTWHRGVKYDMAVASVTPADFDAVLCINTDIEVDFGANEAIASKMVTETTEGSVPSQPAGRRLNDPTPSPASATNPIPAPATIELRPEPPVDQKEGVCVVQLQGDGVRGRRRFDVQVATVQDLFDFAASLLPEYYSFRLVTRFPRRIFTMDDASSTLSEAGIASRQEAFMLERL